MTLPTHIVDIGSQDHYQNVDLYDYEYRNRRRDARFYLSLAKSLQPEAILEMCCGSGRVTRGLAKAGFNIDAFDLSLPMLEKAQARLNHAGKAAAARVNFECKDMMSFTTTRSYPFIVMAFNSFEHLYTRTDVSACLERVHQSLNDNGVFAFDVQMPNMNWLLRDPNKRWARTVFRHPTTKQRLEYTTNHDYDPVSQITLIRIFYKPLEPGPIKKEFVVHLSQRKFFPAELEALLHYSGLKVIDQLGDFDGEPLDDYAENQVLVCKRR